MAQLVKSLPTMWETWVQSLGWEDPLGKGKATHFQYSGLENSMDSSPWGCRESDTTKQLSLHFTVFHKEVETWVSGTSQMDEQAAMQ